MCSWSKEENFHLTDALLSAVESKEAWAVAFGFKARSEKATSGGNTLIQMAREIGNIVLKQHESGIWADVELIVLGDIIKNRLAK